MMLDKERRLMTLPDDLRVYASLTEKADWRGIFEKNGDSFDAFGTKRELLVLKSYLEPGEVVFALASGVMSQTGTSNASDFGSNTWLIALTNERFLCLDHAMFTKSVDTQSIRLDRVQAVSASQGWILGKIMIDLGSRLVKVDNCQKKSVAVMADLANKWLRYMADSRKMQERGSERKSEADSHDLLDKLERLAKLHASGSLNDDEFAAAKKKLL